MADRTLVKNYLMDAADGAGEEVAAQITWLQGKRKELSAEVGEGDWEIGSASLEGTAASGRRGLNAKARLEAVIAAIEQLQNGVPSGGAIIEARFGGVLN